MVLLLLSPGSVSETFFVFFDSGYVRATLLLLGFSTGVTLLDVLLHLLENLISFLEMIRVCREKSVSSGNHSVLIASDEEKACIRLVVTHSPAEHLVDSVWFLTDLVKNDHSSWLRFKVKIRTCRISFIETDDEGVSRVRISAQLVQFFVSLNLLD